MDKEHDKGQLNPNHMEDTDKAVSDKAVSDEAFSDEIFSEETFSDEEFANEVFAPAAPVRPITPASPIEHDRERLAQQDNPSLSRNTTLGWTAIGIAVASLFIWPIVLGPLGAIAGYFAYTRGNRSLGVWSIVLGMISLITYLVLAPYYV